MTAIEDGVELLPEHLRSPRCTICGGRAAAWDCYSDDDNEPGAELACHGCEPKVRGLGWVIEPLGDE